MPNNSEEILNSGSQILGEILHGDGFTFTPKQSGRSSGGMFAAGEFRRGNRVLELHYRHSLGLVTYHLGNASLTHQAYMLLVLGKPNASHYPGFSDGPLDGFRHLRDDLVEYGKDFLTGSDDDFLRHIERSKQLASARPKIPF